MRTTWSEQEERWMFRFGFDLVSDEPSRTDPPEVVTRVQDRGACSAQVGTFKRLGIPDWLVELFEVGMCVTNEHRDEAFRVAASMQPACAAAYRLGGVIAVAELVTQDAAWRLRGVVNCARSMEDA